MKGGMAGGQGQDERWLGLGEGWEQVQAGQGQGRSQHLALKVKSELIRLGLRSKIDTRIWCERKSLHVPQRVGVRVRVRKL